MTGGGPTLPDGGFSFRLTDGDGTEEHDGTEGGDGTDGRDAPPAEGPSPTATLRLLRDVSSAAIGSGSVVEAVPSVLSSLCVFGGWRAGHLVIVNPDDRPTSAGWWPAGARGPELAGFREATAAALAAWDRSASADGDGDLLEWALGREGRTVLTGSTRELGGARAEAARRAGLRRVLALPIRAEERAVAVLELFSPLDRQPGGPTLEALELVRRQLDLLAARERARQAVRHAARGYRRLTRQLQPTVERLRAVEERYALLSRGSAGGLWDWDLRRDRIFYSPRWKALLGYEPDRIGPRPSEWLDRIHADDRDRVELELLEHLDWQAPCFESLHRVLHADGVYRRVRVRGQALRDDAGRAIRIAGSLDTTGEASTAADRAFEDLLYHRATGLPTRALLLDRIQQAIRRRGRRLDQRCAALVVALEGREASAEELGPEAAEELHLTAARRLEVVVRPGDTVAHLEPDSFGLLLEEVRHGEDAVRAVRRVLASLGQPFPVAEAAVELRAHVGIALGPEGYERAEALLRDAGLAMRRARRRGVPHELFDEAPGAETDDLSALQVELREALERRELSLEYQPVVALDDGRIAGLEALVRWRHPELGSVPPERLLAAAEEAGLSDRIGYWVIGEACRQLRAWDEELTLPFPPSVAVNVDRALLFDPGFVERTEAAAATAGLALSRLRLDVSESALMADASRAARVLAALAERGVRVAIDDFGTGYSSLSYLHRFPVSVLKIDRSFVSGRGAKGHGWDVARSIVELARSLELDVVAEGIETREQFLRLRKLGCGAAQGYFFSPAVPPEKAARLLLDGYPLDLEAPVE